MHRYIYARLPAILNDFAIEEWLYGTIALCLQSTIAIEEP